MQQAQQAQAHQAALDNQFALTEEESENFSELMPVVNKMIGKTTAQLQAEYDQKLQQAIAEAEHRTAAPLQTELQRLRQTQEIQETRTQEQLATNLNREIADLGMGDITSLAAHPEFQRWHAQPAYPGAKTTNGAELANHIKAGGESSAVSMLTAFQRSSETFAPREDNSVVPTGRRPQHQQPLSSAQTQNLNKRDHLMAKYHENMVNANDHSKFPPGISTRAQYKAHQAALQQQIDAIPTV